MVSIAVSVYNAVASLEQCVSSILNGHYRDIELILVDDGSPDDSGALCDTLAKNDDRIVVIHKENGGVSSARNAGIRAARGEHLLFVDSDDYVEPDYVQAMVTEYEAHKQPVHVWCNIQTVSGYNRENPKPNVPVTDEVRVFTKNDVMTLHELWLDSSPCNKLFSVSVLKENGVLFDETLSLGEDWLFVLHYLDVSGDRDIVVLTQPLYNYVRGDDDSLDSRYRADLLDIYRRIHDTCEMYLVKWQVNDSGWNKFYNSRFYAYEKVMANCCRAPHLSKKDINRQNSRYLKSDEFQTVFAQSTCSIHPAYRMAYRLKSYRLVRLLDKLYAAKQKKRGTTA